MWVKAKWAASQDHRSARWFHALATWRRWRKHMIGLENNNPIWTAPVKSLSPIELSERFYTRFVYGCLWAAQILSRSPVEISQRYGDVLRRHGDDVTVTVAPGLGHDILLEPVTLGALTTLVETVKTGARR